MGHVPPCGTWQRKHKRDLPDLATARTLLFSHVLQSGHRISEFLLTDRGHKADPGLVVGPNRPMQPGSSDGDGRDEVQSVRRAIEILKVLSRGPQPLGVIAKETNLAKPTTYRLLRSMRHDGVVLKDPAGGGYILGPGLAQIAQGVTRGGSLVPSLAKPGLIDVWERTEETVTLHIRTGTVRVCIEEIPSPHPVRYTAAVGSSSPLHAGAAGKMLLAMLSDPECSQILRSLTLVVMAEGTITDLDTLVRDIKAVRKRGWAYSASEGFPGVNALSIGVSHSSGLNLALSIVGPATRLTRSRLLEHLPTLRQGAERIEEALITAFP